MAGDVFELDPVLVARSALPGFFLIWFVQQMRQDQHAAELLIQFLQDFEASERKEGEDQQ